MGEKEVAPNDNDNDDGSDGSNSKAGVVARLAVRQFDPDSSKPSSRSYTTRKVELTAEAHVTKEGVQGDYNHYRSVALKSTQDRAISLQTNDVLAALRSEYPKYDIRDGDLGENVSVDNVPFDFFQVGKRYKFVDEENEISTSSSSSSSVIVEITEKMDPCANLCKLSYINDDSVEPKQRIARCQDFLQFLDRYDGYRGWYAKVIQEGFIQKGSKIVLLD
jgi:MOSC domain-containing protein YiiM